MKAKTTQIFQAARNLASQGYVFCRSFIVEGVETLKLTRSFYRDSTFKHIDERLDHYIHDPFAVSKAYLKERGEGNVYQYGETPLSTMYYIAKKFGISSADTVIEMGAGRGRLALFLSHFFKCQVIAVDQVPTFVKGGQMIAKELELPNVEFVEADLLEAPLQQGSYLYLYQSMLDDDAIESLCEAFAQLGHQPKIITVSYSLPEYDNRFKVIDHMRGEFIFGKTDVYLNQLR